MNILDITLKLKCEEQRKEHYAQEQRHLVRKSAWCVIRGEKNSEDMEMEEESGYLQSV
jgi:hypothetical protein